MESKLELRMYGLVNYQLSGIQKAIQFGHAVVEYSLLHRQTDLYKNWAENWKTFIILNGGTTNKNSGKEGTLNKHVSTLAEMEIIGSFFQEPDLGDQITAVVFIVDERVFKKDPYTDDSEEKYYPDFEKYLFEKTGKEFETISEEEYPKQYEEWLNFIGGGKNLFLRNFLGNFKLA